MAEEYEAQESIEDYTSIEEKPKKSLKIPALIIGIIMIVAGIIGIAITIPMFFQ